MAKTNQQIDTINELRKSLGEEPIPYENDSNNVDDVKQDDVNKKQDFDLAQNDKIEIDEQKEKSNDDKKELSESSIEEDGVIKITKKNKDIVSKDDNVETKKEEEEIEDERLLRILSKKAGREIKSFDDLVNPTKKEPTKEEIEAKEHERETNKITFALQNKKITPKEIESFIEDTKNPKQVAYNFFFEQQKELDPSLSNSEIKEKFEERYHLNDDEDSAEYKYGQKELIFIANTLIRSKHNKYLSLEDEYSAYEKLEQSKYNAQKEILEKAPQYKKDVESARSEIKKIKVNISENESYEVELEDGIINEYVSGMLTPEYSTKMIQSGYSVQQIIDTVQTAAIKENLDSIVSGVVNKALLKRQAGLKGVYPQKQTKAPQVFSLDQEKRVKELKERLGVVDQVAN